MRVLYLLNRVLSGRIEAVKQGKDNDDHLYGMLRLSKYGIETGYVELEQYLPKRVTDFLRKHVLNIYWVHVPLFFQFFAYDAVITSMSFGSQLLHTLYPFKKPKWIMLDFGLDGLLGEGKTLKQKLLAFIVARASGVVTIDAYEKMKLEKRFPSLQGKIEFIRFAVDTEFFKPHPVSVDEKLIYSPGRDPGRDFKTLFQAIEGLDVRVVLTARPGNIRKLLPLPTAVSNTDLMTEDYVATFAKASIVVIPLDTRSGVNNTMGMSTLVEAMAMGKAIIVTRTPTSESYVEHGRTGLLVPAQDPQALRKAIVTLLQDPQQRAGLGRAARAFAEEYCSADGFAEALAVYLKDLA
jgi:glycosyltransferase involved in cell wall biosynthesis